MGTIISDAIVIVDTPAMPSEAFEKLLGQGTYTTQRSSSVQTGTSVITATVGMSALGRPALSESWIARDPLIASGHPVVKGTRIPIWLLAGMHRNGYSAQQISESFERLPVDVVNRVLLQIMYMRPEDLGGPVV